MLQEAASIADLVGAAAVVVSLIFVGLQLRQANKQSRVAARQEQIDATGLISRLLAEDAELADIWTRAIAGLELTPVERTRLVAYLMYVERMQEGLFWQYLDGQVDEELWEAHRRQARAAQNFPVVVSTWELRKKFFSARYQKFRDEETTKVGDDRIRYDVQPAETPKP